MAEPSAVLALARRELSRLPAILGRAARRPRRDRLADPPGARRVVFRRDRVPVPGVGAAVLIMREGSVENGRYVTGYLPYLTLSPGQGRLSLYLAKRGRPMRYPFWFYEEFARKRFPWLEVRSLPPSAERVAAARRGALESFTFASTVTVLSQPPQFMNAPGPPDVTEYQRFTFE